MTSTQLSQSESSVLPMITWETSTQTKQRCIVLHRGYNPAGKASLPESVMKDIDEVGKEGPVAWTVFNYICTTLFGTCAFRGTKGCCNV